MFHNDVKNLIITTTININISNKSIGSTQQNILVLIAEIISDSLILMLDQIHQYMKKTINQPKVNNIILVIQSINHFL